MKAEFFDRQDEANPLNGTDVTSGVELLRIIDRLGNRSPFFCELVCENGYKLLVGIGRSVGCAQYSSSDGKPPYLMATSKSEFNTDDCVEFLMDHTLTPVPRHYCVSMESVRQIAQYFVETGSRSPSVSWEEIRSTKS